MVERALTLRETLKPGGSYAVVWAGIIPYFAGGNAIDLLGKNDRTIAHLPMHDNFSASSPDFEFYPGHMKYSYDYSVGQLRPDAIVQFWSLDQDPPGVPVSPVPWVARPYVDNYYSRVDIGPLFFYFRKDSTKIRWETVGKLGGLSSATP